MVQAVLRSAPTWRQDICSRVLALLQQAIQVVHAIERQLGRRAAGRLKGGAWTQVARQRRGIVCKRWRASCRSGAHLLRCRPSVHVAVGGGRRRLCSKPCILLGLGRRLNCSRRSGKEGVPGIVCRLLLLPRECLVQLASLALAPACRPGAASEKRRATSRVQQHECPRLCTDVQCWQKTGLRLERCCPARTPCCGQPHLPPPQSGLPPQPPWHRLQPRPRPPRRRAAAAAAARR